MLNSYELGMKANLGNTATLNVSAFYYDYRDYQAFSQVGVVQSVINLDATAQGLEAELNARPMDGLTLQLGASFLDSKVKDILLPDHATVVDHDLPQAPSFSGNALARYEFPLGGGTASVQARRAVLRRFLLHRPVRACRKGEGVHGRQRPHRLWGSRTGAGKSLPL